MRYDVEKQRDGCGSANGSAGFAQGFLKERGIEGACGIDASEIQFAQAARGLAVRGKRREAEIGPVMGEVGGCQKDGARLPESCQAGGGIAPVGVAHERLT